MLESNLSKTVIISVSDKEICCYNPSCLAPGEKYPVLSKIVVSILQVSDGVAELSVRCPYCSCLICSFGLKNFFFRDKPSLKLPWKEIISQMRERYQKNDFSKVYYDYAVIAEK